MDRLKWVVGGGPGVAGLAAAVAMGVMPMQVHAGSSDAVDRETLGRGRALFQQLPCGDCHTLSDAGSTGQIGPVLDENFNATTSLVKMKVTYGGDNNMPAFSDQLTEAEIADIAAYVAHAAGN